MADPNQEILAELRIIRALLTAVTSDSMATDADADGKYGDPEVRFDPHSWSGPSLKGRHYSQCPPGFLDELSRALTQMAAKDDAEGRKFKDKPASTYSRWDAAKARRWAFRLRTGWTAPAAAPTPSFSGGRSAFGNGRPLGAPQAAPQAASEYTPPRDDDDEIPF